LQLLDAHRGQGAAVLTVTHSLRVAERADRVLTMIDGEVTDAA
jgi:ABC-type lipoprotein export system ATPase subunit